MRWLGLAALLCAGPAWGHALECPVDAPSEWAASPRVLSGVQVLSAKHGEVIDEATPPDLVPDDQSTRGGVLHSVWRMNSDGPEWLFLSGVNMPARSVC